MCAACCWPGAGRSAPRASTRAPTSSTCRARRSTASTSDHIHNDLQAAALELEPEAGRALGLLRAAGATAAQLSGSGPAAFGLFEDPAAAAKALAGGWRGLTAAFESAPAGYAEVRSAS